ncbi:MAG: hypothetical protein O7B99_13500 [Planctomycetota bacterium]|nr:hypothetical protein [Planctomycetota bacterium]
MFPFLLLLLSPQDVSLVVGDRDNVRIEACCRAVLSAAIEAID